MLRGSTSSCTQPAISRLPSPRCSISLRRCRGLNLPGNRTSGNARDCFPDQSKLVCNLVPLDVETALHDKTPGAWNYHFQVIRTVLNYGKKKGYLGVNPCDSLDRIRPDKPPTQIATPETVEALLVHAEENEIEMLPFLVFTFFCGIRPGDAGEMAKL